MSVQVTLWLLGRGALCRWDAGLGNQGYLHGRVTLAHGGYRFSIMPTPPAWHAAEAPSTDW